MPRKKNFIKRLSKKEVKDFIENQGAKLHKEYTELYYEKYFTGFTQEDLVYELPNGNFFYVYDPKGIVLPGKGIYYERNQFLGHVRLDKMLKENKSQKIFSSWDHWKYYSKLGLELIHKGDENLENLSNILGLEMGELDFTYKSLGKIDFKIKNIPQSYAFQTLYDPLVYFVGEIIRIRVDGKWAINEYEDGETFPFIAVENSNLQYRPINIVWSQLIGINPCNLRKATADEIKAHAWFHPKNRK